jgi:hypothetical protein
MAESTTGCFCCCESHFTNCRFFRSLYQGSLHFCVCTFCVLSSPQRLDCRLTERERTREGAKKERAARQKPKYWNSIPILRMSRRNFNIYCLLFLCKRRGAARSSPGEWRRKSRSAHFFAQDNLIFLFNILKEDFPTYWIAARNGEDFIFANAHLEVLDCERRFAPLLPELRSEFSWNN